MDFVIQINNISEQGFDHSTVIFRGRSSTTKLENDNEQSKIYFETFSSVSTLQKQLKNSAWERWQTYRKTGCFSWNNKLNVTRHSIFTYTRFYPRLIQLVTCLMNKQKIKWSGYVLSVEISLALVVWDLWMLNDHDIKQFKVTQCAICNA